MLLVVGADWRKKEFDVSNAIFLIYADQILIVDKYYQINLKELRCGNR